MTNKTTELAKECQRLSESCLYSSTSFFILLRHRRLVRGVFTVVPLVFGAVASWQLLMESGVEWIRIMLGVLALVGGVMPSIYAALKFDDGLEACRVAAARFKNLQDRFRQLALISSRKAFEEFEREFLECRADLEGVREAAITPPEWCFRRAQAKVKKGDYSFDVDIEGVAQEAEEQIP